MNDVTMNHRELTNSPQKRREHNEGARYVVAPGKSLIAGAIDRVLGPGDRVEPEYLDRTHDVQIGMERIKNLIAKGLVVDRGER